MNRKLDADADAVLDENGAEEAPREEGAGEHGDTRVQTDEHARTNEGGRPLEQPGPVFNVESPVIVVAPDVKPGENMPVIQDSNGIVRGDALDEGADEGGSESLNLLDGLLSTSADRVHGVDGDASGRSWREEGTGMWLELGHLLSE